MKPKLLCDIVEQTLESQINKPHDENYKHFAYVVQNNIVVASGRNKRVAHKTMYTRVTPDGVTLYALHAEYNAYQSAKKKRHIFNLEEPWEMVVIRLNNHLRMMYSVPCDICKGFLSHTTCTRVYFSDTNQSEIKSFWNPQWNTANV